MSLNKKPNRFWKKDRLIYTSNYWFGDMFVVLDLLVFYSEENIYKFLEKLKVSNEDLSSSYVVFVSNQYKSVGLFQQIKGDSSLRNFIVWDYHVFLIRKHNFNYYVYDFDTILDFPERFDHYFSEALRWNKILPKRLHRLYRVISGDDYLNNFSSDRQHMKHSNGSWISPPPIYECIHGPLATSRHNLSCYLKIPDSILANSVIINDNFGEILTEDIFYERFIS